MKTFLLTIFGICSLNIAHAQQFSFQMKFVDAIGNKDSITLGYDINATDSLDPVFEEINIISNPYTSALNVRAGNVWFQKNSFRLFGQTAFETKTQIVPNTCGSGNFWSIFPVAEINIVSPHFPIKAYWNHSTFNNPCLNGSVFTSVHPGGWWDTGGFRDELKSTDSATFYQNQYYYMNGPDTVNVYWVALTDSTLLSLGVKELNTNLNTVSIFPNPSSETVSIKSNSIFGEITQVEFINLVGQTVKISNNSRNISISELSNGLYFVKVNNNLEKTVVVKLQKK
jgi:hypothetical protein